MEHLFYMQLFKREEFRKLLENSCEGVLACDIGDQNLPENKKYIENLNACRGLLNCGIDYIINNWDEIVEYVNSII